MNAPLIVCQMMIARIAETEELGDVTFRENF
jgi:hypothetical protein